MMIQVISEKHGKKIIEAITRIESRSICVISFVKAKISICGKKGCGCKCNLLDCFYFDDKRKPIRATIESLHGEKVVTFWPV